MGYPQPNALQQSGLNLGQIQSMNRAAQPTISGSPMAAKGGPIERPDATTGGFVSQDLSPSNGGQTDDVPAQLNAGEFVIPKDVAAWKGQEFFYKLMAGSRKMRAMAGSQQGQPEQATGYQAGGDVDDRWGIPEGYYGSRDLGPGGAAAPGGGGMSVQGGPNSCAADYAAHGGRLTKPGCAVVGRN